VSFRFLPFALLALPLAGCGEAPKPPEASSGPLPAQVCTEVGKALDSLRNQAGVEFDDKGAAMVEQAAWLAMAPEQRDSLVRALAFRAACSAGRQNDEQQVTIRNEEGMVVTQRIVSTRVDMTRLGQGEDRPGAE
jgi:hypothetical protein